jgi:pyruvate-formate lyase
MPNVAYAERVEEQIQKLPARIERLKNQLLSRYYETDIERIKYYTEVYKNTEGQPQCIRAAKGLEKTLSNMTIRIGDDELIVGSKL